MDDSTATALRDLLRQRLPREHCGKPLEANGFTDVRNVPGSWKAWTAAGYPSETPANK